MLLYFSPWCGNQSQARRDSMSGFQSRDAQQNLGGAFGPISPGRCQREIERRLGITSTSTAAPAVAHVPAAAQAMPVPRRSLSSRIVGAVWPAGGVVAGTPVVQSSSSPTAVVAGTPVVVSGTPVAPVVAPARGDGTTFRAHLHQIYAAPGATPAVAVVEGAPVQPARSLSGRLYDRLPSSSDLYNALPSRPRVLSGSGGQTATREPILPAATPRSDAATLRSPDAPRPARQPSRPVQLARQASRTLYATVAPPPPSEECTAGTVFRTIKYRPSWCQVDGSAPSARPVLPKAQGARTDPKAPQHCGSEARHGLRRPPQLAPKIATSLVPPPTGTCGS